MNSAICLQLSSLVLAHRYCSCKPHVPFTMPRGRERGLSRDRDFGRSRDSRIRRSRSRSRDRGRSQSRSRSYSRERRRRRRLRSRSRSASPAHWYEIERIENEIIDGTSSKLTFRFTFVFYALLSLLCFQFDLFLLLLIKL